MIQNLLKKFKLFLVTVLCFSSVSIFAADSFTVLEEDAIPSTLASQGPWDWQLNYGQIKRLYPSGGGNLGARTFFQLKNGQTAMNPANGYYYIPKSNPNYQAMVDLLYLVTEKGWKVNVRTQHNLDANGHAEVVYLVVDR